MTPETSPQIQATLYTSTNTTKPIRPSSGRTFTSSELKHHIGGDYQYWILPSGAVIVAASDTILDTEPRNELIFRVIGIPYVGNVIIGDRSMFI